MDFAKITRDEFMKKYFDVGCPSKFGLDDLKGCRVQCCDCWDNAIKDIKFKDDLEPNIDLFEEKTTLTFNPNLHNVVGKPIRVLKRRGSKEYVYGLIKSIGEDFVDVYVVDGGFLTLSASDLAKLDPTILD